MYALPEQTLEQAIVDIEQALEMQPDHISHYHLTLEPNTVFYSRPPPLPDEDLAWDMQQACAVLLEQAGYDNYEISAWARSGYACRHNLNYWRYGDYLGLGAGAHAKVTVAPDRRWRESRAAHPREYLRRIQDGGGAAARWDIPAADARFEFMLNGLRLREGIRSIDYERRTGLPASSLDPGLQQATTLALLEEEASGRIRPTALGRRFLDDLQAIFLPTKAD
jgi:oxygen-independent coproporphyrinogen-3 oxidase